VLMRHAAVRLLRTLCLAFFRRHKITFKKSASRGGAGTCGRGAGRRRWMREQGMFDPARLVFIDDSANTKMVRL